MELEYFEGQTGGSHKSCVLFSATKQLLEEPSDFVTTEELVMVRCVVNLFYQGRFFRFGKKGTTINYESTAFRVISHVSFKSYSIWAHTGDDSIHQFILAFFLFKQDETSYFLLFLSFIQGDLRNRRLVAFSYVFKIELFLILIIFFFIYQCQSKLQKLFHLSSPFEIHDDWLQIIINKNLGKRRDRYLTFATQPSCGPVLVYQLFFQILKIYTMVQSNITIHKPDEIFSFQRKCGNSTFN